MLQEQDNRFFDHTLKSSFAVSSSSSASYAGAHGLHQEDDCGTWAMEEQCDQSGSESPEPHFQTREIFAVHGDKDSCISDQPFDQNDENEDEKCNEFTLLSLQNSTLKLTH